MRALKFNYFLQLSLALVLCATLVGQTRADPTVGIFGGTTTVTLSEELLTALGALAVTPAATGSATLSEDGIATFPITSGALDLESSVGEIAHIGGLSLTTEDGTIVDLFNFTVNNASGSGPDITLTGLAALNADLAGRFSLFKLDFSGATVDITETDITITGVAATLTGVGADALNAAFGVTAFVAGITVGTADIAATL